MRVSRDPGWPPERWSPHLLFPPGALSREDPQRSRPGSWFSSEGSMEAESPRWGVGWGEGQGQDLRPPWLNFPKVSGGC